MIVRTAYADCCTAGCMSVFVLFLAALLLLPCLWHLPICKLTGMHVAFRSDCTGIKIRVGSNSQLPPLSPSTSNDYKRATPSGPISPSLANSKSERKPSPLKDRFRSMAGAAAAGSLQSSAGAAVASAAVGKQGSPMRSQTLPPITKDRSRSRHVS